MGAKALILMVLLSLKLASAGAAGAHVQDKLSVVENENLSRKESRIPFPLLPPGSLPPAMLIPNIALEPESDLLNGRIVLEDSTIFGLDGLSLIADLSVDFTNTLIVNLRETTAKVGSLRLSTIQEMDFILDMMGMITGHFVGTGAMNITITNLIVELDVQLRLTSTGQLAAEVLTLALDVDELLFEAENFTVTLNDVPFDPNGLLELIKLLLPSVYPELEPTLLELLTDLLSGLLENCGLTDLLGLDLSCTGLFPEPPTEAPISTDRPTPPPTRDSALIWTSWSLFSLVCIALAVQAVGA